MELLREFIDFFLHLDVHLAEIIERFGAGAYGILFLIVFCETGLVVTPFLPGDSLLFAAGAFAALGSFEIVPLMALLILAAIAGDTVNYWIGARIGPRAFSGNVRFLKQEYLVRTTEFYEKHGGKTIVLARFIPIVRTFAPFVAGVGRMNYARFLAYNVVGAVVWVTLFTLAGFYFGNIPAVKENFTLVILAIIGLSVLPIAIEMVKARRREPA
ncbi:MAG TPA: DedA family protein [Gemmatimonadales bacterium]|nr:DedA family protein [Gemmatimonadales bacterium]